MPRYDIDNMTASKIMVETNIQRPEWLPSEKAKSFKLWTDAVRQEQNIKAGRRSTEENDASVQGRTSAVACKRFGISARMLDMYIKLNDCAEDVLSLCDAGRMTVTAAYQLSFLPVEQQNEVAGQMASEPERTLNEDAAKSIRYAYEGRPLETSAEADEGAHQAPAPVPEEIRDFELSVGGYPEGCEPSGGVSHDASTDTDTAVGMQLFPPRLPLRKATTPLVLVWEEKPNCPLRSRKSGSHGRLSTEKPKHRPERAFALPSCLMKQKSLAAMMMRFVSVSMKSSALEIRSC